MVTQVINKNASKSIAFFNFDKKFVLCFALHSFILSSRIFASIVDCFQSTFEFGGVEITIKKSKYLRRNLKRDKTEEIQKTKCQVSTFYHCIGEISIAYIFMAVTIIFKLISIQTARFFFFFK